MIVEILSTGSAFTIKTLPCVPRVGDVIIDSHIGQARVVEVVWLTDTNKARLLVRPE